MGDMGEVFREMTRRKKERKEKMLAEADDTGWSKHNEYHWYRELNGQRLDYWPSTTRFRYRGKTMFGDVMDFIARVEK
jgi:hypothetical protein